MPIKLTRFVHNGKILRLLIDRLNVDEATIKSLVEAFYADTGEEEEIKNIDECYKFERFHPRTITLICMTLNVPESNFKQIEQL